jgi:hypothetical protein
MRRLLLAMAAVLASALLVAPVAQAKRLSSSAANAAAERAAGTYAAAHDAEDAGVDACARRNARTIVCDVFASIPVDDVTQRECTATVTVRLGTRRRARPVATTSAWTCVDEDLSGGDEEDEDAPVDEEDPLPADDEQA